MGAAPSSPDNPYQMSMLEILLLWQSKFYAIVLQVMQVAYEPFATLCFPNRWFSFNRLSSTITFVTFL
jgi:hypothetical protein